MCTKTINLERPVIILGAPRAGTSILGRILERHPDLVHVKEPRLVWRYGNDARSDMMTAKHARPEIIRYIRHHFAEIAKKEGQGRLLEKTPSNSLRIPFIEEVFPDAQYVHITRNGYDAALSIRSYWMGFTRGFEHGRIGSNESILRQRLRELSPRQLPYYAAEFLQRLLPAKKDQPKTLWGPRLPGLKQMVRDMDLLEVAALQWRQCVELAKQDAGRLGKRRYHEIRLEDLTLQRLKSVLDFLGLEMHEDIHNYFEKEFQPSMSSSRRKSLTDEERVHLRRMLEPTMQWLGYEVP